MENTELKRAGFGIRLGAYLLDYIFIELINSILMVPFLGKILTSAQKGGQPDFSVLSPIILISLSVYIVYWVVIPYLAKGKSFGKMIVGIQVLRQDGEIISFGRLLLRETIGKWISSAIILIGYLMALGEKKLALHDMIANTQVVYNR